MILKNVEYRCFDYEVPEFSVDPGLEAHELDREIVFGFEHDPDVYVSWAPVDRNYHVATRDHSWFSGSFMAIDASAWTLWKRLIGQPIVFNADWVGRQVLEIRAKGPSVYVCTLERGMWFMDTLTIRRDPPTEQELAGLQSWVRS